MFVTARVDHTVVSVDHNVWVVGDELECVVIDAPHDVDAILELVSGRSVKAILGTHAYDGHLRAAPALRSVVHAPILIHPADRSSWELMHPDELWDVDLSDGQLIEVGGTTIEVLHTPVHSPGAVCFLAGDLGCVFTGDSPVRGRLLSLPGATVVHPGHGPDTTFLAGKESPGG